MARANYRPANLPPGFRKPRTEFTAERKNKFLVEFASTGRVIQSSLAAGVTDYAVRNALKSDEEFAEAYELARQYFCDLIEAEVKRRGMEGWEEPVYQKGQRIMEPVFDPETGQPAKDESGQIIFRPAVVRRFSDRMLELFVKRHISAYRDKQQVDVNVSGGVLVIPASGAKPVDWEKQYGGSITDVAFERVEPEVGPVPIEPPPNEVGPDDNPTSTSAKSKKAVSSGKIKVSR